MGPRQVGRASWSGADDVAAAFLPSAIVRKQTLRQALVGDIGRHLPFKLLVAPISHEQPYDQQHQTKALHEPVARQRKADIDSQRQPVAAWRPRAWWQDSVEAVALSQQHRIIDYGVGYCPCEQRRRSKQLGP